MKGLEKKTPLYEEHVGRHARLVPFAGFLMPLQYSGIIEEHRAVREAAGVFDLSHMGEFWVTGDSAVAALNRLTTNDLAELQTGAALYTPLCNPDGGIVDDVLVYKFEDGLMLVVNASNIDKDFDWISSQVQSDVLVENVSDGTALIAIQGPRAEAILQAVTGIELARVAYYHFTCGLVAGVRCTVSRTGYTGEDGFELYTRSQDAADLWKAMMLAGEGAGLKPAGLGARDTLRLEAGLMLYGNDIDDTTNPLEAGLSWTVKVDHHDFVGRQALERQRAEGLSRRSVAFEMCGRGIPRPHMDVVVGGDRIGEVTSGTFSPTFRRGIGFAYVKRPFTKPGTEVEVVIRDHAETARVVRRPMYRREDAP